MVEVPTKSGLKSAAMDGGSTGGASAVGEIAGRSVLGAGFGTAVGGIVTASMLDGMSRETAASLAVERGINELVAGGSAGGSQSRGVM